MTANSRCNAACPCGDAAPKAKRRVLTPRLARVLGALMATFPAGAITTIVTGDLRPLGVGLVLFISGYFTAVVAVNADKATVKAATK